MRVIQWGPSPSKTARRARQRGPLRPQGAGVDIDSFELGSAFQTEAGVALSMVPERFVDTQFARFMEHMVRDIEAGRPLPPLGTRSFGVRSASERVHTDPDRRRRQAEAKQRAASRPMNDARPMVDPNRSADRYLSGRPQPEGGWGR